jgi:hypothetical protein
LAVLVLGLVAEGWALAMRHDRLEPATYWLRHVPKIVRVVVLLLLTWHFLFCGAACR